MKDKRQRVALAWPYGLTADPAFYAYLVNAAAAAASLSQYSYAANQQSPPPTFNYATGSSAVQRTGCSFPPSGSPVTPAQFPPFPVGLAAAAAAMARIPGTGGGPAVSPGATPLHQELTAPDVFPAFMPYRSNAQQYQQAVSSSPVAVKHQSSTEQRTTTSALFQPYKTDDDRQP